MKIAPLGPSAGESGDEGGAAGAGGVRAVLDGAEPRARGRLRARAGRVARRAPAGRPRRAAARLLLRPRTPRALLAQVRRQRAGQGEPQVTQPSHHFKGRIVDIIVEVVV